MRGGIVDLFPPGAEQPLRLDFFGDEVEASAAFDPLTQRSVGKRRRVRAAAGHRGAARRPTRSSASAPAIAAVRRRPAPTIRSTRRSAPAGSIAGMEHWLPLFHEPGDAVRLPARRHRHARPPGDEAVKARLEMIQDFYQARRDLQAARARERRPGLSPAAGRPALSRPRTRWRAFAEQRVRAGASSPFARAGRGRLARTAGGRPARASPRRARNPDVNLFEAVARLSRARAAAGPAALLIAGYRRARCDRLRASAARARPARSRRLSTSWDGARSAAGGHVGPRRAAAGARLRSTDRAVVLTEQDILGDRLIRAVAQETTRRQLPRRARRTSTPAISSSMSTTASAATTGWRRSTSAARRTTACELIYDGGDKLFVPVENIDVLSPLRRRGRRSSRSTSWAAPAGRRARRGSSSASATWPTS